MDWKRLIIGGGLLALLLGGYEYKKHRDLEEYVKALARVIQDQKDYRRGKTKERKPPLWSFIENKPGIDLQNPEKAREQMEKRGYVYSTMNDGDGYCSILGKIKERGSLQEKGGTYKLIHYKEISSSCRLQPAFFYPPGRIYFNISLIKMKGGALIDFVQSMKEKEISTFGEMMGLREIGSILEEVKEEGNFDIKSVPRERVLEEFMKRRTDSYKYHELTHAEGGDEVAAKLAEIAYCPQWYQFYSLASLLEGNNTKEKEIAEKIFNLFEQKGHSKERIWGAEIREIGDTAKKIYREYKNLSE